jgi:hypothetical protein
MSGEPVLEPSDKILILIPDANSHRRDFEHVFLPEAQALSRHYGRGACKVVRVPVAPVDPRTLIVQAGQQAFLAAGRAVLAALRDGTPWTHVVFMCHGWATGLQLGFRSGKQRRGDRENMSALVAALRALPLKVITLYACSAGSDPASSRSSPGSGDDSFADTLRDATGVTVIAHVTVGHATRNPHLIVFEANSAPVLGGIRLPEPGSKLFKNAVRLLSNRKPRKGVRATGDRAPRGHGRPVFASIPLCRSALDLQALLSVQA